MVFWLSLSRSHPVPIVVPRLAHSSILTGEVTCLAYFQFLCYNVLGSLQRQWEIYRPTTEIINTEKRNRAYSFPSGKLYNGATPLPKMSVVLLDERLGDHIHTNFRDLYENLRQAGYFLEVLQQPLTCFDASKYGTLMIVDPEEEFWPVEVFKLEKDVKEKGLSLLVFGGWYNTSVLSTLKFYDSNNKRLWMPITGGSNVPALNKLLSPLGIQLGDRIFSGEIKVGTLKATYPSGSHLTTMPATLGRSLVLPHRLVDLGQQVIDRSRSLSEKVSRSFDIKQKTLFSNLRSIPTEMDSVVPVLGLWTNDSRSQNSAGRVAVFGDSMCLDSSGGSKSGIKAKEEEIAALTSISFPLHKGILKWKWEDAEASAVALTTFIFPKLHTLMPIYFLKATIFVGGDDVPHGPPTTSNRHVCCDCSGPVLTDDGEMKTLASALYLQRILSSSVWNEDEYCFWLARSFLDFAVSGKINEPLASSLVPAAQILTPKSADLPKPIENVNQYLETEKDKISTTVSTNDPASGLGYVVSGAKFSVLNYLERLITK
ncbi:hypothetical protein ACTXT7_005788 [Hymenolepis weldensis]